jgi:soluble lytic murein transglycosylase-like protein
MVRLTHMSGSLRGTFSTSPKAVIRIGRGADCDVRFDARLDTRVSTHHAEIRFDNGYYLVVDTGSSNGTLVNGKLVRQQKLKSGDKIVFGAQGGPEVRFEVDDSMGWAAGGMSMNGGPRGRGQQLQAPALPYGRPPPPGKAEISGDAASLAREAQMNISRARAMSGGQPSGQTMFIMADTLKKVEAVTHKKDSKKTAKIVFTVLLLAFAGFGALGFVIWQQKQQLEKILHRKGNLDRQIQKIQLAMQIEGDPDRLAALEDQLTLLTGKAQQTIGELQQKDKAAAEKVENQGDELDREIRRILSKFSATTYLVPPLFKERLQYHIQQTVSRSNTRTVYSRKQRYWPMIVKEFSKRGLPEEMAYVAWTESQFDPLADNPSGARGMWQFMAPTARDYGLRVDKSVDQRIDAQKETQAAAHYLANLLSDFGEDSFMLAIASYNKGEAGMRRVLREVGFRKEKRDFWHLYRLKKLPEETLEYVPQILAAAVICNNPKKYGLE